MCRKSAMFATTVAFFATFFSFCDIPVFWPILLMYFIILFVLTMKNQIAHMIKHKYLPFSLGKPKHAGKGKKAVTVSNPTATLAASTTTERRFDASRLT